MVRSVLVGAALVAIGAAAAVLVISWRAPTDPAPAEHRTAAAPLTSARGLNAPGARADGNRHQADIKQRLQALGERAAEEAAERQPPEEQVDELDALFPGRDRESDQPAAPPPPADSSARPATAEAPAADPAPAPVIDYSKSAMERALLTAGLDPEAAAEIKSRHDAVAMSEIYLRDQATREEWLDSPRFDEEMAALAEERPSIRDEIGDVAYDRYLFAMGQTNRVRIDEVLLHSPAAQVGLQPGDMILRYGETRLFGPGDLVAETRSGRVGDPVRLQIIRNGERLEVEVARGPLGLQVAATQDMPTAN